MSFESKDFYEGSMSYDGSMMSKNSVKKKSRKQSENPFAASPPGRVLSELSLNPSQSPPSSFSAEKLRSMGFAEKVAEMPGRDGKDAHRYAKQSRIRHDIANQQKLRDLLLAIPTRYPQRFECKSIKYKGNNGKLSDLNVKINDCIIVDPVRSVELSNNSGIKYQMGKDNISFLVDHDQNCVYIKLPDVSKGQVILYYFINDDHTNRFIRAILQAKKDTIITKWDVKIKWGNNYFKIKYKELSGGLLLDPKFVEIGDVETMRLESNFGLRANAFGQIKKKKNKRKKGKKTKGKKTKGKKTKGKKTKGKKTKGRNKGKKGKKTKGKNKDKNKGKNKGKNNKNKR